MKQIIILLGALLLAALALPAQSFFDLPPVAAVAFEEDTIPGLGDGYAIFTVVNQLGETCADIGAWKETAYEEHDSPAGMYATSIISSVDVDSTRATPLWWAYRIIDRVGNYHYEIHIFNMVLFQGNRWIINSLPRPAFVNDMWQECQY